MSRWALMASGGEASDDLLLALELSPVVFYNRARQQDLTL